MRYIFIQVLLNIVIFRFSSEKVIRVYKKLAYILYPVLISILIILPKRNIEFNGNYGYGFVLDITDIYSKSYLLTLVLIILIQFLYNTFLYKLINSRIADQSGR